MYIKVKSTQSLKPHWMWQTIVIISTCIGSGCFNRKKYHAGNSSNVWTLLCTVQCLLVVAMKSKWACHKNEKKGVVDFYLSEWKWPLVWLKCLFRYIYNKWSFFVKLWWKQITKNTLTICVLHSVFLSLIQSPRVRAEKKQLIWKRISKLKLVNEPD